MKTNRDVIIIGAGASGLMCGIEAGKRGRSVVILEHEGQAGRKILVSGGGRCNFTNIDIDPGNYISGNPHFCKSALARFGPEDISGMLKRHGIRYHEKERGQLFCNESSRDILMMLKDECRQNGVNIITGCRIAAVERKEVFKVSTDKGEFSSGSLVIATGGLSYPALGATDLGYRIANMFGIGVTPLKPALVPFTFGSAELKKFRELSGVSIISEVRCKGEAFSGEILFTHKGMSGPAILQISSYWNPGDRIIINLFPGMDAYELLRGERDTRKEIRTVLSAHLPRRFVLKWLENHADSRPMNQYSDRELREIAGHLMKWEICPSGTEGYRTAEVTAGGIDTAELSSKTMEARRVRGLYFIGEVVDVTGRLGGYNLHWAWASGAAAGRHL